MNAKHFALFILALVAITSVLFLVSDNRDGKKAAITPQVASPPAPVHLLRDPQDEKVDHTMYFYDAQDLPGTTPYMSIVFGGIPRSSIPRANELRELIDRNVADAGGIHQVQHYDDRIAPAIDDHLEEMMQLGGNEHPPVFSKNRSGLSPLSEEVSFGPLLRFYFSKMKLPTIAAVSARSVVSPRFKVLRVYCAKRVRSFSPHPPSGPMKSACG